MLSPGPASARASSSESASFTVTVAAGQLTFLPDAVPPPDVAPGSDPVAGVVDGADGSAVLVGASSAEAVGLRVVGVGPTSPVAPAVSGVAESPPEVRATMRAITEQMNAPVASHSTRLPLVMGHHRNPVVWMVLVL